MTEDSAGPDADPQGDETRQSEATFQGARSSVLITCFWSLSGERRHGRSVACPAASSNPPPVAIKVIKAGMDTRQVIARFEAERQALALMDHPTIATVFDGGATPQGRPVLRDGICQGRANYDLLRPAPTCHARAVVALHAGVRRGVARAPKGRHRPRSQPSNVLVTLLDDRPLPKISTLGLPKQQPSH